MDNNKKAAQVASTGTAQNNTIDKPHSTKTDPLQGWYSLAGNVKPSRTARTQKRGWKRSNKGRIDPLLALHVALMVLAAMMLAGVSHA